MSYYKDPSGRLHFLDDDSFSHLLPDGCVAITQEEAIAIEHPAPSEEEIQLRLTSALERRYDEVAQSRRYDNRFTCALRAGFPGPFQEEGLAFAQWMDACNAKGYQIIGDVRAGGRPIPTEEELLAEMPAIIWPK